MDKLAYGWSPEEMHYQHPNLSLSQIHGALACYYDHQQEIDNDIQSEDPILMDRATELNPSLHPHDKNCGPWDRSQRG
jgi:hypothetical protein